jgi:hypothetical protein
MMYRFIMVWMNNTFAQSGVLMLGLNKRLVYLVALWIKLEYY